MAITQLGLHGPQMAYAGFTAKAAAAVLDIAYELTLYAMQVSANRLTAVQSAKRDLYAAQRVKKTMGVT